MKKNIIRMNEYRMFEKTNEVLLSNEQVVNLIAGLVIAGVRFKDIVKAIGLMNKDIEQTTTGITERKQQAKIDMTGEAQMIANRTMAFANTVNDTEVYQTMSKLMSKIVKANDGMCYTRCLNVADAAEAILPKLVQWNVKQADIDLLNTKCAEFKKVQNSASVLEDQINTAIMNVNGLIGDGKKLLRKTLDKGVKSLIKTQPTFVEEYFRGRRVQNLGHRITQFKGLTLVKGTQQELSNCEIQFKNDKGIITVRSDEKGNYRERLNPDVYDIMVIHPNCEPFVIAGVRIQPGEIKVEDFELSLKA